MDENNIFIVVSQYQRQIDNYGGRVEDFDIHETYATAELAEAFLTTADLTGPSVPGWKRRYSIVVRPLNS